MMDLDISDTLIDADVQNAREAANAAIRDAEQAAGLLAHLADREGARRIPEKAVLLDAHVDPDDVADHGARRPVELGEAQRRQSAQERRQRGVVDHLLGDEGPGHLRHGALEVGRRRLEEVVDREVGEIHELEADLFRQCAGTADFTEGIQAFLGKRAAQFTGR